jgi:hypothetical protein
MQTPDATGAAAPSIVETLAKLETDPKAGLTDAEVQARLKKYGPNALVEKQKSAFAALLAYFWGPIPWMIEAAALMAFIVGDWGDFAIITSLLLFNALLGFWEEHEASNALDALKSSLALKPARCVAHDGRRSTLERSFRETSFGCTSATLFPLIAHSLRAITSASINPLSRESRCRSAKNRARTRTRAQSLNRAK